jgi:phenolphthiocerol/phthiocerol/phthiodiolone dimycocerosyl transferase
MFPSSVIRNLSRSEEIFAAGRNFIGLTLHLSGPVDVDAMSTAFETLLEAHPALAGHLEPGPGERHQIVVDDYLHEGIWVERAGADPALSQLPDQGEALVNLRLVLGDERSEVTLYTHHGMADAHHQFALLEELFSWYTDEVSGTGIGPVSAMPTPQPLEAVLAERGVLEQRRSGLERLMAAMYAYELPPSKKRPAAANRALPVRVPSARCLLTEEQTRQLTEFCRVQRLSLNSVVSAAILLAEWRLRDSPKIPIPYVYPVNLRLFLSPPVAVTASTNPLGVATYLAEIGPATDLAGLARDIVETFRADLADGVIQQSLLHFSLQYEGNPPGLPDVVMNTDSGEMEAVRTPDGLVVDGYHSEVLFDASAGFDMYACGTFAGRLLVEYHTHATGPERYIAEIRNQLCSLPAETSWVTD